MSLVSLDSGSIHVTVVYFTFKFNYNFHNIYRDPLF